jgi:hypothetical protein
MNVATKKNAQRIVAAFPRLTLMSRRRADGDLTRQGCEPLAQGVGER